jgi:hypothetical protein
MAEIFCIITQFEFNGPARLVDMDFADAPLPALRLFRELADHSWPALACRRSHTMSAGLWPRVLRYTTGS